VATPVMAAAITMNHRTIMTTPLSPSTAIDPPRGLGLAWGGPAPRPVKDRLTRDIS
jgi:hypothetical protein